MTLPASLVSRKVPFSVTKLGEFWKFLYDQFCFKSYPNEGQLLGHFWKASLLSNNCYGHFWTILGNPFYFNIWPHCPICTLKKSIRQKVEMQFPRISIFTHTNNNKKGSSLVVEGVYGFPKKLRRFTLYSDENHCQNDLAF